MKLNVKLKSTPRGTIIRSMYLVLLIVSPICLFGQNKVPIPNFSPTDKETSLLVDAPHWGNGIDCMSCHVVHNSADAQLTKLAGNANLCMSCHNPAGMASNKPFTNADRADPGVSGTSHAWAAPATNPTHGAEPPVDPEMALRIYSDNIVCSTCHNQHSQTITPFLRATNYQNALCKDCHAVRDVGSYRTSTTNKGSHPVGIAYPSSDDRFHSSPQNPDLPLVDPNRVECTTCHSPHYADSGGANGGAGDGFILRAANDKTLCEACHTYPDHEGMDCSKCHQPHDPNRNNILLVRDNVQTPDSGNLDVVFTSESGSNSFADGDGVYNGICEVCHTGTGHHRNNSSGDHAHFAGTNCTECHPHNKGFKPQGCTGCHQFPRDNGDNVPPGGRRAIVSEFEQGSHHVQGVELNDEGDDCVVCHEMSEHTQGHVRLVDRDNPQTVYELTNRPMDDPAEAAKLVPFCLNCHDGDNDVPFTDGKTPPYVSKNKWNASAHKLGGGVNMPLSCIGDGDNFGCHATGHGSPNIKILNVSSGVGLETFCYNCHTDGRITNNALSGSGLANDIQQAFSMGEKHNLGTNFTIGSKTFTLQCTTCHNPHVVTGKHWNVNNGVTPITRPNLGANPTKNPRAMGTDLWGDGGGEKMDNFAALGSGTGGWYYSTARGGKIIWDQPAVYQPPKTGSGYNFEFDGNVLPDYATFCLDCHTNRVSSANPPVNWGQGIACTDNSVDPPNQRIECGAQHGLAPANKPSYVSDSGTAGFWGSSGNPDVLFQMNYVTRGRGVGHFMRWPYDSADRSAGINFVMSCTDCHEAHGSGVSSMLRSTINATGPGTVIWNTMCNNCHYYYGGQHAGMSCGNASCHEVNSIHRIIHVTHSGGTQLQLTASGYQGNYQRPDFTPEIVSARGAVGSNELEVTFVRGAWAKSSLSGSLTKNDFWLFDEGGNNPRSITGVSHSGGEASATITMSSALESADLNTDLLATTGKSVWAWYEGGYNNPATGIVPAQAVSAGPWPAVITPGCPTGTVTFPLNEPAGSFIVTDDQSTLIGTVGNPSYSMLGDGTFHGAEGQGTYIDFTNNNSCLNSPGEVTIEARVKPTEVDRGVGDNTFNRIFERRRTILVTILNTDYRGDDIPERAGKASIEVKYRVENFFGPGGRHTCPDPQWPDDPYVGNDVRMHQISSNIDLWPIVNNHWYKIKVVFNSDKSGIPGSNGTPVDIFIDDQGPNGNDSGQNWSGYVNASKTINESSSCRWGSLPGDVINDRDDTVHIGASWNYNQPFAGQIDWVTWKPNADYSGVSDPPH